MRNLRLFPPATIASIKVAYIEDYERSMQFDIQNHQSSPLFLPKSNIMLFWLTDGSKLTIRPSGTEPKLKIYCEVKAKNSNSIHTSKQQAHTHAEALIQGIKDILQKEF
jgi:phosphomannomutase